MRKYGKWLLVLGVMAACPAFASAEGFLGGRKPSLPFSGGSAQQTRNQAMAEDVASALREARLNGYDVEIEVKDGVATLNGKIRDAAHRAMATQVASNVAGIRRVENNLRYVPGGAVQQASASSAPATGEPQREVSRAVYASEPGRSGQVQKVSGYGGSGPMNQQVAEQIGASLSQSGLTGYYIEARYSNGVATLSGNVATVQQRQNAAAAAARVPGVSSVNNQLQVNPAVAQTPYVPGAGNPGAGPAMSPQMMPPQMQQQMMPPQMPPQMMQQQMMQASMMQPAAAPGGYPSPMGVAPASYTNPHLPAHAWPAYAQYPNSAAVSYPTQYSASAWPYIGPFYPYPQVPLGWREVSLEWDDGYWQLNFNKEKDKWYWILSPKNW